MTTKEIALARADAVDLAAIVRALPDPSTLEEGTRVVVLGSLAEEPSLKHRLFAAFGLKGDGGVPRALRCTALVARGYVGVGAAEDGAGRDIAFGSVPSATAPLDY